MTDGKIPPFSPAAGRVPAGRTSDQVAESILGETAAVRRPKQWATILRDTWSYGRTKVGVGLFAFILLLAVLGPAVSPHSPTQFVGAPFASPSHAALLGTDNLGRDVLARVLWGGWSVVSLAAVATAIGMALGVTLGLIAGYASVWLDEIVMRLGDVILAFPTIVFVLLLVSIEGPKVWLIVLAVGIGHAPRVARVARGATLEVAQNEYVESTEAIGVSRGRILFGEILPNITSPLLVEFALRMSYSVGIIAALSFLGFGIQPPNADWGLMINENRIALSAQPYAVFIPVLLIATLTIAVNFAADGLSRAIVGIERETGA